MIKLETLLEKHPDDIDSTSGVIIEQIVSILYCSLTKANDSN